MTDQSPSARFVPDDLYSGDPAKVRARVVELVAHGIEQAWHAGHSSTSYHCETYSERIVPKVPSRKRKVALTTGKYVEYHDGSFCVYDADGRTYRCEKSAATVAGFYEVEDQDLCHAELMALKANPEESAPPAVARPVLRVPFGYFVRDKAGDARDFVYVIQHYSEHDRAERDARECANTIGGTIHAVYEDTQLLGAPAAGRELRELTDAECVGLYKHNAYPNRVGVSDADIIRAMLKEADALRARPGAGK